jgi:restriction system protein
MAEITTRRQGELIRGIFAVLKSAPDGLPAREVLMAVERSVPPTPYEAGVYESNPNVPRYGKIARFSTINAVKAGWLVKDKGHWSLTDEGKQAYEQFPDAEAFYAESRKLYRAWKKAQPDPEDEEATDDVATATTLEEAEETAWSEIRQYLVTMPPYEFQALVGALLGAMGYYVDWIAPPGRDQGIDLIAHTDPLGTSNPRIKVQVKRQAETKVTADGLRAFLAVLGEQDVGLFISAGGFTSEAERESRAQERRRLTLIDLDRLVALWIEHFDALNDKDRLRLPLRPVYFLSPIE